MKAAKYLKLSRTGICKTEGFMISSTSRRHAIVDCEFLTHRTIASHTSVVKEVECTGISGAASMFKENDGV